MTPSQHLQQHRLSLLNLLEFDYSALNYDKEYIFLFFFQLHIDIIEKNLKILMLEYVYK